MHLLHILHRKMTNITLAIQEDIRKKMSQFPEINWSEIARAAIIQRVSMLERFKEFTKESTLTEEDAIRLGREVNKRLAKRYVER